jgi:Family of unknown function (DUF6134)
MQRIRRRILLAWGLATAAMGPAPELPPVPAGDTLAFRIMRHGRPIGTHTVVFERLSDDGLNVHIAVNVLVKFGPIPLVRYAHHGLESWRAGRLAGLLTHTNRNGTDLQMRAWRTDPGLQVEGTGTTPYVAPPNALPTTYWNPRMKDGPMIGTQKGTLVIAKVTDVGIERIPLASGGTVATRHYTIHGNDMNVDVHYDFDDVWAGMSFTVEDGSLITYERL